jgi:hypothetical protein
VAVAYVWVAFLCLAAGRSRAAWWLLACSLLWTVSVTGTVSWMVGPARVCWSALWATLAVGAVDPRWRAAFRGQVPETAGGPTSASRSSPGGLSLRGTRRAAGGAAVVVAAATLLVACLAWVSTAGRWVSLWWPGAGRSDVSTAVQGACALMVPIAVSVAA